MARNWYGPYRNFSETRKAIEGEEAKISVNHFMTSYLIKNSRSKVLSRLVYFLKIFLPPIVCFLLNLFLYPSPYWWVAALVSLIVSYIFDVGETIFLLGLAFSIGGMISGNSIFVLFGAPLALSYALNQLWWYTITQSYGKQVLMGEKEFKRLWDAEAIMLIVGEMAYSSAGSHNLSISTEKAIRRAAEAKVAQDARAKAARKAGSNSSAGESDDSDD